MNKMKLAILTVLIGFVSCYAYAGREDSYRKSDLDITGPFELKDSEIRSLKVKGPVSLKNVRVEKDMTIYGPLKADTIEAKKITVYGPLEIDHSKMTALEIYGPLEIEDSSVDKGVVVRGSFEAEEAKFLSVVEVYGSFKSKESEFAGDLLIMSESAEFKKSKCKTIILDDSQTKEGATLTLKETTVDGDVTFKSGKGKLVLKDGAKVTGSVTGASRS